jgi:DNA-binding Xre family transcriptional regulator
MNPKNEFEVILKTLKKILKNKKITYSSLAESIEMSESGVKKLLSGSDCSLAKILQICDVIEVELTEVLTYSKESASREFQLSRSNEMFFIKHWDYFTVFWKLFAEKKNAKEIMKENSLSKKQIETYLLKLDRMGLLEFHSIDKVVIDDRGIPDWVDEGPLVEVVKRIWPKKILDHVVLAKNIPKDCCYELTYFKFSKDTHMEYVHAMREVAETYLKRSAYEEKVLHKDDLLITTSIMAVSNRPFSGKVIPGESMLHIL